MLGKKYVGQSEHMTHAHRNNENKRQTVYTFIMNIWLMVNKEKFCEYLSEIEGESHRGTVTRGKRRRKHRGQRWKRQKQKGEEWI